MKKVFAGLLVGAWAMGACATVYTWTGSGAAGNWSDAANWSPVGVPNAGDTAVFPAEETSITSGLVLGEGFLQVDVSGVLDFSGVLSGAGGVCKQGAGTWRFRTANTYAGGTVVSNGVVEAYHMQAFGTSSEPLHLASDGDKTYGKLFVMVSGEFAYPIHADDNTSAANTRSGANVCALNTTGEVTYKGAITGKRVGLRTDHQSINVDAPITLPEGRLHLFAGNRLKIRFYKKVVVKDVEPSQNTGGGTGDIEWHCGENDMQSIRIEYKNHALLADNALGTRAVVSFGWTELVRSQLQLNDHALTIDRIDYANSTKPALTHPNSLVQYHRVIGGPLGTGRLTMRATADCVCSPFYEEAMTLVWWPQEDYTYTTWDGDNGEGYGRVPTMSGAIIVSNGTFVVNGTNAFPFVSSIEVADRATFSWQSKSPWPNGGLASVKNIKLGAGAAFDVTEGALSPYPQFIDKIELAEDASLTIPAGKMLTASVFVVGGQFISYGTYTGADNPTPGTATVLACLKGTGTLFAQGQGSGIADAVWTGAVSEEASAAGNWEGGQAPDFVTQRVHPVFSTPGTPGNGERVYWGASESYWWGAQFNGACDVSVLPASPEASLVFAGDDFTFAEGAEGAARRYTIGVPAAIMAQQTWTVDAQALLQVNGKLSSRFETADVTKKGAGELYLCATNSTLDSHIMVKEGTVRISGDNAFGSADARLTCYNGSRVVFAGGTWDGTFAGSALGTATEVVTIEEGTTNTFNAPVTFADAAVKMLVNTNSLTVFNKPCRFTKGWSYLKGSTTSKASDAKTCVLRFNDVFSMAAGQSDRLTFDCRAPGNTFGTTDHNFRYGSYVTVLLNCEDALNADIPLVVRGNDQTFDLCGHDNTVGTLETARLTTVFTNSGEKATLWVRQQDEMITGDDKSLYPIVQCAQFAGPLTLGKLGPAAFVITNSPPDKAPVSLPHAISSTGDIIVQEGRLAFCEKSSWLGAETVSVSGETSVLEIRQAKTLGKRVNVYLASGGRMTLGVSGADEAFEQRIGFLYIDGVKQGLGRYSADVGGGVPAVAGTRACASLSGPGVLFVAGDGKGTAIFIR